MNVKSPRHPGPRRRIPLRERVALMVYMPVELWKWLTEESIKKARETGKPASRAAIIRELLYEKMRKGE